MKRKDIKSLHNKDINELNKEMFDKKQQLKTIVIERKTKQNKNVYLIRELRDDIARIQTIIRLKGDKHK